jgi:hypothetical protein
MRQPEQRRESCQQRTPLRPAARPLRPGSRSGLIDGNDDTPEGGPSNEHPSSISDPALLDFAQWFTDWWLRRGCHLTNPARRE